ncbi:MAG: hypothetical protein IJB21_04250 [Bacilli bacterium]|nr:hypothetical protein [Bacilli bacterium]
MNKAKAIKIFMVIVGVIIGLLIIAFMVLNHYIFDLDFIYVVGICILILILWIIINYVGIKIIMLKK